MDYYKKNAIRLKLIPDLIRSNKCNLEELTHLLSAKLEELGLKEIKERTLSRDIKFLNKKNSKNFRIRSIKESILGEIRSYYIIEGEEQNDFLSKEEKMMFPILMGLLNTEKEMKTVNWLKNALMMEFGFKKNELNPEPYFVHVHPELNFKDEMLMLTGKIIEYIKRGQAIFFNYIRNREEKAKMIAPLQVRYYDNRYYLLGTEVDEDTYEIKNLLTTFSLDKILGKEVFPARIENDENEERHIFFDYNDLYKKSHLEELLKHSIGIFYSYHLEKNKLKTFRFKFTDWAIGIIENKNYHHSQKIVERGSNYVIVEMKVWDNNEIDFFVGRFGDACVRLN